MELESSPNCHANAMASFEDTASVTSQFFELVTQDNVDQDWDIVSVARKFPPWSWEEVFTDADPEIANASAVIKREEEKGARFAPLKKDIFSAFKWCPLHMVKVVILGQDPYPTEIQYQGELIPRATGLSFSVRRGDDVPQTLLNIYKEISDCYPEFVPPVHGDLTGWASQGVLLLNIVSTFKLGSKGDENCSTYSGVWAGFTRKIIKAVCSANPGCIFVLWGKYAQSAKIHIPKDAIILESPHPSPLSARRGFFGCKHFSTINSILKQQEKEPIDWSALW
jgi:uracil-DNA glycosylase